MGFFTWPFRVIGQAAIAVFGVAVLVALVVFLFAGIGVGVGMSMSGGDWEQSEKADKNYLYEYGDRDSENRLLMLPVEGIILGSPLGGFNYGLGLTYGYVLRDILMKVKTDESVKGILLYVRSPGGTIFGSRAIAESLQQYKEATGKPVLAYIEGLAASGGVMAMVPADEIYADYGSLIGSIGVRGPSLFYFDKPVATSGTLLKSGIVTEGGIEQVTITAGRGKDLGNPFRRPTEAEIEGLQAGVNAEYDNFVSHVAAHRPITAETIRQEMGAQIFDNARAKQYGLIDGTKDRDAAIARLAELAGLENYQLVRYHMDIHGFWENLTAQFPTLLRSEKPSAQPLETALCDYTLRGSLVYYGDVQNLCNFLK